MYLQRAGKYQRPAWRPSQGQKRVLSQSSIFGQNPKIWYQEFNDLQTPKLSKKQLCDRTARPSIRSTTARVVPGRLRARRCTYASAVATALYAPSGVGAMACAGDGGRLRSSCGNEATR